MRTRYDRAVGDGEAELSSADAGPAYVKGDVQRPDATEPTDDGRHRDATAWKGDDRHRASDRGGCRSLRDGPMYRSTDDGCRCYRHWGGNYRGDCCLDDELCYTGTMTVAGTVACIGTVARRLIAMIVSNR